MSEAAKTREKTMIERLHYAICGTLWMLAAASLAGALAAQETARVVDCAELDAQKFAALPDEQIIVCDGAARTAGEVRAWAERRNRRPALFAEEAAAAGERLQALHQEQEADEAALRARMEEVLRQARGGATFADSRGARRLAEMRPQLLELERQMQAARTPAARERIQARARELLARQGARRPHGGGQ